MSNFRFFPALYKIKLNFVTLHPLPTLSLLSGEGAIIAGFSRDPIHHCNKDIERPSLRARMRSSFFFQS
jgi:hypothetical protein